MGEIAYLDFVLRKMHEDSRKPISPIDILVDDACGMSKKRIKEAKRIIARIKKLEKLL